MRTRTKQLGANEKARRKKCHVRFSIAKGTRVFQKDCMRIGVMKLLRMGLVPAKVWGGQAVDISPHGKVEVEAADGGSSWQERRWT